MARAAAVGIVAVVLVTICFVQEATAASERVRIGIRLSQRSDTPHWVISQAQEIVSAVFSGAGVDVLWADDQTSPDELMLTVMLAADAPAKSLTSMKVLAVAIAPDTGCGRIAYAIWPRVQAFARAERVSEAAVLGRVLAHEVGHLLLGQQAHSDRGIMRASWNQRDFTAIADRAAFTPEQAARIRQRISDESQSLRR